MYASVPIKILLIIQEKNFLLKYLQKVIVINFVNHTNLYTSEFCRQNKKYFKGKRLCCIQ